MARTVSKISRLPVWYVTLCAAACLALAVLVGVVNLSSVLTVRNPQAAASLFYANAVARGRIAQEAVLAEQTPNAAREALGLARVSVARDPTAPMAMSAAAFAFEVLGEGARTRQALLLSDQLSRRILPVQMWLIEDSVRRGDVSGALHRYDVALRTSRQAQAALFPVLNAALADRKMIRPIARMLAGNPAWRGDFLLQLVNDGPVVGASDLAMALASMRSPLVGDYASLLMLRLSRLRDYDRASAVLRASFPETARATNALRDPNFVRPNTALPFGWQFADDSDLGVAKSMTGRGGAQLYANGGAAGEAARQLMALPAGRYRLTARYGEAQLASGATPRWQVVCGSEAATKLADVALTGGSEQHQATAMFAIPAQGCAAQWVFLIVPPATSDGNMSVDLASLAIDRVR